MKQELVEEFKQKVNEATNGNVKITVVDTGYFGICDNKVIE